MKGHQERGEIETRELGDRSPQRRGRLTTNDTTCEESEVLRSGARANLVEEFLLVL